MAVSMAHEDRDSEGELEKLEHEQRLKAALHYTVGQICSEVEDATFSREFVATITESTFKQCELLARDLEMFAKHAKRTTISMEDVKLCCRRNASLFEHIQAQADKIKTGKGVVTLSEEGVTSSEGKVKRKGEKKRRVIIEDD